MAIYRVRYSWEDSDEGAQEWFPSEVRAKARVAELRREEDVVDPEIKKLDSPTTKAQWLKLLNRDAEYC